MKNKKKLTVIEMMLVTAILLCEKEEVSSEGVPTSKIITKYKELGEIDEDTEGGNINTILTRLKLLVNKKEVLTTKIHKGKAYFKSNFSAEKLKEQVDFLEKLN